MTLTEYLESRGIEAKALSRAEAVILGFQWPLVKGWAKRFASQQVSDNQIGALSIISTEPVRGRRLMMANEFVSVGVIRTIPGGDGVTTYLTVADRKAAKENTQEHSGNKEISKQRLEKRRKRKQEKRERARANKAYAPVSKVKRKDDSWKKYAPHPSSDEFLQSYAWRRLRMEAFIRYGRKCLCCGATPESGAILNVDHIKPRKLFPNLSLDIENTQILCGSCNHGKGNWDHTDWRES